MYRLTTPEGECLALDCYGIECVCTPDENCDEGCLNQRIARLAQYENTGLAPEQVTELKERREEKEQADNWISCEERMPEPDTLVIVACYGSDIIIPHNGETLTESIERVQKEHVTVTLAFIGSDGWYGCDYFPMMITPTYWQPLPEPPKGE